MENLENYFLPFKKRTIGDDLIFKTPFGEKKMIYADWIASGRLYKDIEEHLSKNIGPFVGNTHTNTTDTGSSMTYAYEEAHKVIKKHVNGNVNDVVITSGAGMTDVINKFQRILGLRVCEKYIKKSDIKESERAVVLVTHMEHHSNHISWHETIADVIVVPPGKDNLISLENFEKYLKKYKDRKLIISSITACSNVTGIIPPYYKVAELTHRYGGVCFVDFACSAPYVDIDMHPKKLEQKLDAIYFSPHKFLGGPGSSGILVFNSSLYHNTSPDTPGGGTVTWTTPWGKYKFFDSIEVREDGGTPPFLQTIKASLSILLKERMGTDKMLQREHQIIPPFIKKLKKIKNLHILAPDQLDRVGAISFYIDKLHYNLAVRLLNDHFGIQTRGGCSCAGTYGHFLLNISKEVSKKITIKIDTGDLSEKPGWIRVSLHPTMSDKEVNFIAESIEEMAKNFKIMQKDYIYDRYSNEFIHKEFKNHYKFIKNFKNMIK